MPPVLLEQVAAVIAIEHDAIQAYDNLRVQRRACEYNVLRCFGRVAIQSMSRGLAAEQLRDTMGPIICKFIRAANMRCRPTAADRGLVALTRLQGSGDHEAAPKDG